MRKQGSDHIEPTLKKAQLRKAYEEANRDEGQIEAMKDWESTIGDDIDQEE